MDDASALAPPKLNQRPRAPIGSAVVFGAALLGGTVLFVVDPVRHAIYPACLLYATTGLKCPGCGGLRATHQLLHGHFAAAWALNPLALLLLPLGAWLVADAGLVLLGRSGLPKAAPRPVVIWLGLVGLVLFGLLRNLPWW